MPLTGTIRMTTKTVPYHFTIRSIGLHHVLIAPSEKKRLLSKASSSGSSSIYAALSNV